ncbi:MAG: DNA polymerase IV [Gammaproteobacteria bacterium]|nr:DNA polymerase IV [Gammaproteobacteria bacterium]
MDAFYASVAQRDDPTLRGRPVVVGWQAKRGVVCAASYEARACGVRSAMPIGQAERLCPSAVFVAPDFAKYRAVSAAIGEIFRSYTPLVEPLSLDEAYLDVTANLRGFATATQTARAIRAEIAAVTQLTASAGVAPNKFLAKIASDWRKPNGLFVVQPHEIEDFLAPLPVARLPGVGPATARQLLAMGAATIADLRGVPLATLSARLGRAGERLHELAWGRDERPVCPDRPVRSVSSEMTFEQDLRLTEIAPLLVPLAAQVWRGARDGEHHARTAVLKLKTADFRTLTRSVTPPQPPTTLGEFLGLLEGLLGRVELGLNTRYRLVGTGLANFYTPVGPRQSGLFCATPEPPPAAVASPPP